MAFWGEVINAIFNSSNNSIRVEGVSGGTGQDVNVKQVNGVTPLMGNGATGTGSARVTVASDNTPFAVKTDQTTHGTTDLVAADITKLSGTAIATNSGNTSAGTQRVVLATDQPAVPVSLNVPTTIGTGRTTVTTAGTRVALTTTTACKSVIITALSTNTGTIVVGGTAVVAAAGTRQGTPINAGESVSLDISDLASINLDSTVNGEGVSYTYVN